MNRVLKKILGPSRKNVMGELRELRNEELRDLYLPFDIIWGDQEKIIGYNGEGTSHVWEK